MGAGKGTVIGTERHCMFRANSLLPQLFVAYCTQMGLRDEPADRETSHEGYGKQGRHHALVAPFCGRESHNFSTLAGRVGRSL